MKPVFNERKATQVAAIFLKLGGGCLTYMKLIKLMYLADRKALLKWGRPITYDSYFSLKHGPILSSTLDLINEGKRPNSNHIWFDYISPPNSYSVSLRQECHLSELSEAEEKIIEETFAEYGKFQQWDLVDYLHSILPEWKNPGDSSIPISYRDILRADGKSDEEIEEIEHEIDGIGLAANTFGFF